jgi:hypothetical protein
MLKILAIACICLCTLVIAYVIKIYRESPDMKVNKEDGDKHKWRY